MKKLIALVAIIVLLFSLYQITPVKAAVNSVLYQSPCATPKTFRIGSVDSRFGITKDQLIIDAKEAGSVWKNAQGMVLMQYDPKSAMPINMVYDQRQQLDTRINSLNNQVSQQQNTLKPQISDYEARVAAFKKKSAALNAKIQYWNSRGGAPQDVYNDLVSQQQELQQEANQLQQIADQLNQSTDQYNSQIQQLNQQVDTYNNVLAFKPEEGLYVRDGTDEKIDIYFNNSQQELIHTLAHEMGHALGLGHNNNPNSIMYPQTNEVVSPSVDDENALAEVCKKQNIFELAGENIYLFVATFKQHLLTSFAH